MVGGIDMAELDVSLVERQVARMCCEANYVLPADVARALEEAGEVEESPVGRCLLEEIRQNAVMAREQGLPLCQDTGMALVFVELGQEVRLTGGSLSEAINRGVARGYTGGLLRKSVVSDPLRRVNTGDNTPAVIYYDLVPGKRVSITFMAKGFGSENCTSLGMLKPADGLEGFKSFVIQAVDRVGPNPCPPFVVGIGAGGTADKALLLAKKALLRPLGQLHPDPFLAELESELLEKVNALGYGPGGLGGRVTALAVHIETYPTHIAGLPVAVNFNCHSVRHRTWVWEGED